MEVPRSEGLSDEEDGDLRRLAYLAGTAGLSAWSESRVKDLRSRDRREEVRPPREIAGEPQDGAAARARRSEPRRRRRLKLWRPRGWAS